MPGKYDTARDEMLHYLCTSGWANESDGDVQAPTGCFWRISVTERELDEVVGVFDRGIVPDALDLSTLVGDFVVTEDTQGFVTVTRYPDQEPDRTGEDRARVAFQAKQRAFSAWASTPGCSCGMADAGEEGHDPMPE